MIENDEQLVVTTERIRWFQQQIAQLRRSEPNPVNYRASSAGFLAEIDRMQREVRSFSAPIPRSWQVWPDCDLGEGIDVGRR